MAAKTAPEPLLGGFGGVHFDSFLVVRLKTVSYTHLTLPTICSV